MLALAEPRVEPPWALLPPALPPAPVELGPLDDHRELVLFQLDQLARLPRLPGPKFVFAHIVAPHFPYVLGPEGEAVTPVPAPPGEAAGGADALERESNGYTGELTYVNARVLDLVDQILQTSETPPVIILQGDHGPWVGSIPIRMQILNAYYLPGDATQRLYPTISPVNSFRGQGARPEDSTFLAGACGRGPPVTNAARTAV